MGKIRNAIVHNHYKHTSDIDKLEILGFLFPNDNFILDSFAVHYIYINALKNFGINEGTINKLKVVKL